MKTRLVILIFVVFAVLLPVQSQTFPAQDTAKLIPLSPENVEKLKQLQVYGQGQPGEVAWSPDGKILAVADTLGVWLYDVEDWGNPPSLIVNFDNVEMYWDASWGPLVEFSPNGKLLAFSGGYSIRFWDMEQQIELTDLQQNVPTTSIAFSPDGKQFVSGGYLQLIFWNTETWEIEKVWTSPQNNDYTRLGAISFSPNGELLATNGSYRGNVQLWNPHAETFEDALVANLGATPYDDIVLETEFSPNSQIVVSASGIFGAVRVFNVATFEEIDLEAIYGSSIAFSSDGQYLATAPTGVPHPGPYSGPTTVDIFDAETFENTYIWEEHESVRFLEFNPTGNLLAAVSSFDGRVRILDVSANAPVGIIHTALNARNMAMSSDSQILRVDAIAFDGSGLIDIETGDLLHHYELSRSIDRNSSGAVHSTFNAVGNYLTVQFT